MIQDEQIAAIEVENRQRRLQLEAALVQNRLLERVHELEARLGKDSHNSGKPPSRRSSPASRSIPPWGGQLPSQFRRVSGRSHRACGQ